MKTKFIIILMLFGTVFFEERGTVEAQQESAGKMAYSRADTAAINALVMYPDSTRLAIFEACKYPAVIVRISTEQKSTSAGFDSLVSGYSKDDQQDIWNISRYPGLIQAIVAGGKKSKEQLESIVSGYPQEIRETAVKYGRDHFDVLNNIDQLQAQTDADFQQMIAEYAPVTQHAFQQLLQLPDVLNLLNDHLDITVLVGDHYRRDPQRVIRKADSLNLVLTAEHNQEVQQWQDSINNNPQAQSDLKAAAADYAQENGYSQDEINAPENPDYVNNYTCYPYPYWFGYPTWYPYSYWYPYPYWFDCGFYYGPGGMVFLGLPSYNFTNWYFYNPDHWRRYPHVGAVYVNHYYGAHHGYVNGNTVIVHKWVHDNKAYLPQNFTKNRTNRVEAFKEVGQLNVEARTGKTTGPATVDERNSYLQSHATKYPVLNTSAQPKMVEQNKAGVRIPETIAPPERQPAVKIPPRSQQQPASNQRAPSRNYNYNNVNRAQEYHRSTWEQSQPARSAPAPRYSAPAPSAPAPSRAPSGGGRR